jgi:YD repeat-containing protein
MRASMWKWIWTIAAIAIPSRVSAYPADSTLLVKRVGLSAAGDTLTWARYEYARDFRGDWVVKQYDYAHDTLIFATIMVIDSEPRVLSDSLFSLDPVKGPTWTWERMDLYDAAGRPLRITLLERDSVVSVGDFQYDASGNVILVKLAPVKGPAYISRYEYDAQGRKTASQFFLGDSLLTATHFLYDGNGRQVSQVGFNGKGDTSSITTMEYDGAGRRTRETSRVKGDSLGYLGSEIRNEYDAAGHLVTVKSYDGAGKLQSTEAYVYQKITIPLALAGRARRGTPASGSGPAAIRLSQGRDALGRRLPIPAGAATAWFLPAFR